MQTSRFDLGSHMFERFFIKRGFVFRHLAEVDYPCIGGTSSDVEAISPATDYIAIRFVIRIGQRQPRSRNVAWQVKGAIFLSADKRRFGVFR